MDRLLAPLMEEYQRLMEIEAEFNEWQKEHPEAHSWNYKGKRIARARFERIGVMIRQTMIDYERKIGSY